MAADGSWPSIQAHGLLSTASLIELFEVPEPRRTQLLTHHRPSSALLEHPVHGRAVVRDQQPLQPGKLAQLLDDMTVSQWLQLLNRQVFFWLHGPAPVRWTGYGLVKARRVRKCVHAARRYS